MKKLIIISIVSICLSCKKTETFNNLESDKTEFDWLVGKWIRKNDKDSKQTFENWTKKSNTEYLGLSYTLLKNDTVWKENVVLNKVNNKWQFAVTGNEDKQPTIFKLSKLNDSIFEFENKENEFPKVIQYKNEGNKFSAIVSGNDMTIPFEFEKLK
ncbi:hypothetical protein G4D82_14070 [Flavobacterium sp. CYK-4]|uniref:DUF6265 family protein n=1 Tax=Flavobacterium lotistagni TaxID=2709660 RepID=UPI00140C8A5C|nr:DUF6265 family protein [Flavobacterium lotistagni]NHM08351.1 hypothetical protein [Flavobacterium lotistagni]